MLLISLDTSQWKSIAPKLCSADSSYAKQLGILYEARLPLITTCIQNKRSYYRDCVRLTAKDIPLTAIRYDMCPDCWNGNLRVIDQESINICTLCGRVVDDKFCDDSVSYSHGHSGIVVHVGPKSTARYRTISKSHLKRLNHFRFWVNRLQGKESSNVPRVVVVDLINSLSKNPTARITYDRVREQLKKLGHQRYYNNVYSIMVTMGLKPLVEFSPSHEKMLQDIFLKIQEPFYKSCRNRANMISYPYIIRKICESKGWLSLSKQIPLLKNRRKVYELDLIWSEICKELNLPFKKSL